MSCETTFSASSTHSQSLFSSLLGSVSLFKEAVYPVEQNCQTESQDQLSSMSSSSSLEYSEDESDESLMCERKDVTENGAKSYDSTSDPRLDLFFKTVRGMTPEYLELLLEESWAVSPRDTLRTMFYVRDCRGGKGERKIFYNFMVWLWKKDRRLFEKNIPCIPFYGCFKDLRQIMEIGRQTYYEKSWVLETSFNQMIVSYWCNVLGKDVESLNKNENITLAAKWVPIQDGRFCKEMKLSHKLFRRMVRLLREKLDIVECKMSAGEWDKIYFEKVCSLSMKKYSNAFRRHCGTRFSEYLESVNKGEKKMNVGQLYPSDIAGPYVSCLNVVNPNKTSEVAWEQLLKKCRSNLTKTNKKFICVVDTSGSMNGKPLEVAVSLGLFLSELYPQSKFYRKFITFSSNPVLQEVQGDTLCERVRNLSKSEWNMNTNLQKVFELLLNESTLDDHLDVVLILSDMQFDVACKNGDEILRQGVESTTNLEEIEKKYKEKGLTRPRIVFWNLRANTLDFAATTSVRDCALVSGYSSSLMDGLLEEGEISPMSLFRKTIDNPRYDLIFTDSENQE